jgi:hypothetical protein
MVARGDDPAGQGQSTFRNRQNCLVRDIWRKSRMIVALQGVKGAHPENMCRVTTAPQEMIPES